MFKFPDFFCQLFIDCSCNGATAAVIIPHVLIRGGAMCLKLVSPHICMPALFNLHVISAV